MSASSPAPKSSTRKPKVVADEQFSFTTAAGKVIVVPSFSKVKFGIIRKIRRQSVADQMFSLVEELCDDDTLALLDDLEQDEAQKFVEQWGEFSGVTLGE